VALPLAKGKCRIPPDYAVAMGKNSDSTAWVQRRCWEILEIFEPCQSSPPFASAACKQARFCLSQHSKQTKKNKAYTTNNARQCKMTPQNKCFFLFLAARKNNIFFSLWQCSPPLLSQD
jgi:hypothetical protein